MGQRIPFTHFGPAFIDLIFTEARLKKELDKSFVRTVPIDQPEAKGSATVSGCTVTLLPREGRPEWERVFDVRVFFTMALKIDLLGATENYKVEGQVRMRLWVETQAPLTVLLNGLPVPESEVNLVATGVGNWLNLDIAKKFDLENKLKRAMAENFTKEFAQSYHSRLINILDQVK